MFRRQNVMIIVFLVMKQIDLGNGAGFPGSLIKLKRLERLPTR